MALLNSILSILPERGQLAVGHTALRVLSARPLIGSQARGPYLSLSGEPADLDHVLRQTRSVRGWIRSWCEKADEHLLAADRAVSTAGRVAHTRTACIYFGFANQGHSFRDLFEDVSRRLVAAHSQMHDLVDPVYEPVDVDLGGGSAVAALLRVPARGHTPYPVVVMCQGLERVKEQGFHLEAELLGRGLAVLNVDQPGVGRTLARGVDVRSADRVDAFGEALAHFVRADRRLDASRVGIHGHSMGGATALLVTTASGARATTTLAAPVTLDIERAPAIFRARARFAFGTATNEEFRTLLAALDVPARVGRIRTPVLCMHGTSDPVVPVNQVREIEARAQGSVDVRIFPGGDHSCSQYSAAVWSTIADFLAAHLDEARPVEVGSAQS